MKGVQKYLLKFKRGYSTIEQQVTRRVALKENTYRYTFRRKVFVERTLNRLFVKAWSNMKSKDYKVTDRKNAKEKLILSLKYHYLRYYYIEILDNPSNIEELIERMSSQSRLTKDVYNIFYEEYKKFHNEAYEEQLINVQKNEEKYGIIKAS